MLRRSTWWMVLAFVVIAGAVWLARERQRNTGATTTATPQPTATPLPRLLPDLKPEEVTRIVIEEPGRERRVVLVRVDATPTPAAADTTPAAPPEAQWAVEEPADADAPEAWQVNTALEGLVYASVQAALTPDTDPATVGLAGATQRVILTTQDGRDIEIWIGVSTPLQNGYYVQIQGQPTIMAIGSYPVESLLDLLQQLAPAATATVTPVMTPTP